MKRLALATIYTNSVGKDLHSITFRRHLSYAMRCDAVFYPLMPPFGMTFSRLMQYKLEAMHGLLETYDRVLWVDADILIRADAPSLFSLVPPMLFAAADEGSLCNDAQITERCQHVVQTCREESLLVPELRGVYLNCGLFLVDGIHRHLFKPRKTDSTHNWCEQSLTNARIHLTGTKLTILPECFNRFVYWGPKPLRYEASSYFLHYAGPSSQAKRLADMQEQHVKWGDQ